MTGIDIGREIRQFGSRIDSHLPFAEDLLNSEWLCKYMTNPKRMSERFSFVGREFLIPICDDECDWVSVRKGSQVGATELFVRLGVRWCVRHGRIRIIYTMPTKSDIEVFSADRFSSMLEDLESTFPVRGSVDNSGLKQILEAFIYFRGTRGTTSALSIPADILIHDEIDKSDLFTVSEYASRLEDSKLALRRFFSTPTFSNYGIDKLFKQGDQKWLLYKCNRCSDWVCLMPDSIKRLHNRWVFLCPSCGRELIKSDCRSEFVAKREFSGKSSYQIGKIWSSSFDAESIKLSEDRYKLHPEASQHIWNCVYGLPYDSAELVPFNLEVLESAIVRESPVDRSYGCLVGIDNSVDKHVVVIDVRLDKWIVIDSFVCDGSEGIYRLRRVIDRYNPFFVGIDPLPDVTFARQVKDLLPKVYYVWFRNVSSLSKVDEAELTITLHKNVAISEVSGFIKDGRLLFAEHIMDENIDFLDHFNAIKGDKDKEGKVRYTNMGMPDHFAMAVIYALSGQMSNSHNSFMVGFHTFSSKI